MKHEYENIISFLIRLGGPILSQVEHSGDPISFGYTTQSGANLLVFIWPKIEKEALHARLEWYTRGKKFFGKKVNWKSKQSDTLVSVIQLKQHHSDAAHISKEIMHAIAGTNNDFQSAILESKEPLTFSLEAQDEKPLQVEVVPSSDREKGIVWDVFTD